MSAAAESDADPATAEGDTTNTAEGDTTDTTAEGDTNAATEGDMSAAAATDETGNRGENADGSRQELVTNPEEEEHKGEVTEEKAPEQQTQEKVETPEKQTFRDYINPENYTEQGKYVGDGKEWGYKPYGMENSQLRAEIDAQARDAYREHLMSQPISAEERAELYQDFVDKQVQQGMERMQPPSVEKAEDAPMGGSGQPPMDGPNGPDDPGKPPLDGPKTPKDPENVQEGEKLPEQKSDYEKQLEKTELELQKALDEAGENTPEIKEIYENLSENVAEYYKNAVEIAKQDVTLDNYTDHGPEHIKEVTTNAVNFFPAYLEYAEKQGISPNSEAAPNLSTVVAACVYHDTGMDGGLKSTEEYQANKQAYLEKTGKDGYGNTIRANHPLESAMHVLSDAETLQKQGVEPSEVATVVYMHSKSNSGVKVEKDPAAYNRQGMGKNAGRLDQMIQYYQEKGIAFDPSPFAVKDKNGRWQVTDKDAFVRKEVEQAVERMAETAKAKGVTYDPSFLGSMDENGKFTIRNEAAYTRLQYETAIIREADAQRPVREISMTQSQDGIKLSNVEGDYKSVEAAAGAIRAEFVDPKTGSPVQRQHIQQPDADSVRYYSGERNVDCRGIRYNESTGNLEVHYQVKNGANIPQLSATIIQDRYKEAGMPVLNGNIRHVIHVHGVSEESIQGQQYMKVFGFEDDCEVVFD